MVLISSKIKALVEAKMREDAETTTYWLHTLLVDHIYLLD